MPEQLIHCKCVFLELAANLVTCCVTYGYVDIDFHFTACISLLLTAMQAEKNKIHTVLLPHVANRASGFILTSNPLLCSEVTYCLYNNPPLAPVGYLNTSKS